MVSCELNVILCMTLLVLLVSGREQFVARVPNGDAASRPDSGIDCPHLGHQGCEHGSARNPFGRDFQYIGQFRWTKALCERDSDGDGLSNGEELGDPCCLWSEDNKDPPGFRTTGLSHPGEKNSVADKEQAVCLQKESDPKPSPTSSRESSSEKKDDNASCFPSSALAQTAGGRWRKMNELRVGDRVRVSSGDGADAFDDVFMFTHRDSKPESRFIRIETAFRQDSPLVVSPGHYIHVHGRGLVMASAIRPNDRLHVVPVTSTKDISGSHGNIDIVTDVVTSVSVVLDTGLYNPQTLHGDIVVNGVVCSTYTTAIRPSVATRLLIPFRALYRIGLLKFNVFPPFPAILHEVAVWLLPHGATTEDL